MVSLNDLKVDEKKVWFGDYWPTGVPKQIYDVAKGSHQKIKFSFLFFLTFLTD